MLGSLPTRIRSFSAACGDAWLDISLTHRLRYKPSRFHMAVVGPAWFSV